MFNGFVTGGAENGSSGTLDNNNAFSGRMYLYPSGDWGPGQLADLTDHQSLATRVGAATGEYYFRNVTGFRGNNIPNLFDHGFWLQGGKFVIPKKLELLSRWSRVAGNVGWLFRTQFQFSF